MARICDIYDIIHAVAPFDSQLSFDNSGLLVGDPAAPVSRALLCLDITENVIAEAVGMNANLIISHHPVIFEPLRRLSGREPAWLLAKHNIAALCCHTNLDLSPVCGVNVALASRLGLRNVRREDVFGEDSVLFSGECDPMEPAELARMVRDRLGLGALRWFPGEGTVRRVFLCSGSGGDQAEFAACRGADAFVTGEMKHHEALAAARLGLTCVAAGHYETEILFRKFLAAYLKKRVTDTAFLISKEEKPAFETL